MSNRYNVKKLPNNIFVSVVERRTKDGKLYFVFPKNTSDEVKQPEYHYSHIRVGEGWIETDKEDGPIRKYIEVICVNVEFEELFEQLMGFYKGQDIFDFFDNIIYFLLPKTFDWRKWRGDVAELIFLYKFGGEKNSDWAKADIFWKSEYIEVKSYSPTKSRIKISHSQLTSSNRVVVVPLVLHETSKKEGDCYNIIEILSEIKGNEQFKKIIKERYKEVRDNTNFKITIPKEFIKTKKLPILTEPIKDATYSIEISNKNLKTFE